MFYSQYTVINVHPGLDGIKLYLEMKARPHYIPPQWNEQIGNHSFVFQIKSSRSSLRRFKKMNLNFL